MIFYKSITFFFKFNLGFAKIIQQLLHSFEITEKIKEIIGNKKYGCGIFIDLRNAFDTVYHEILLRKLEHYGIRGKVLSWFKSYLANRKQCFL